MSNKQKDAPDKQKAVPVLVPVDFSESCAAAVVWAARVSTCLGAPLVLLHVVHDPGEAPGYYAVKGRKKQLRRMEDVAADMLDEFQQGVAKSNPDWPVIAEAEKQIVVGLPVNRLLESIERIKPSMVVMGSHGRTGLEHLLLGSKAERVVHLSPVPVTIVKTKKWKS